MCVCPTPIAVCLTAAPPNRCVFFHRLPAPPLRYSTQGPYGKRTSPTINPLPRYILKFSPGPTAPPLFSAPTRPPFRYSTRRPYYKGLSFTIYPPPRFMHNFSLAPLSSSSSSLSFLFSCCSADPPPLPVFYPEALQQIAISAMQRNPSDRPTAKEMLQRAPLASVSGVYIYV